jgi:aerobic carbon-monoxide dehydrogenase medium subunit
MYPAPFHYHRPDTLQDAVSILEQAAGEAIVLAGGQSLIPMMKLRMGEFPQIIDIGRVKDLSTIEQRGDTLHIGAMARHAQIAASDAAGRYPILRDVAGGIADKQVRTMGSIGGGVSIADASGCWPCGLRTMGATIVAASPGGNRSILIDDFILGAYTTTLEPNEIVSEIQIPLPQGNAGGAYVAFKRSAGTYPTVAVGVLLHMDGDSCAKARIVLGGAGSTTIVSAEANALLTGKAITAELLGRAAGIVIAESDPPPDARGSEAFKRGMLHALVIEAGQRALARANGEQIKGGHRYA